MKFDWAKGFTLGFSLQDGQSGGAASTVRRLSQMQDMYADEEAARREAFSSYLVDATLMKKARKRITVTLTISEVCTRPNTGIGSQRLALWDSIPTKRVTTSRALPAMYISHENFPNSL